ncbi:MAG: hypothetical protein ACKOAU_14590 [Pirellula sp.]
MLPQKVHAPKPQAIHQSLGLSSSWVTATAQDFQSGLLGQGLLWAENQLIAQGVEPVGRNLHRSTLSDTVRLIEDCRDKVVRLFMSEGIRYQFENPTSRSIQTIFGLKRPDRLTNSLPFDAIEPQTTSLHLLEILGNANSRRVRGVSLSDIIRLAINSGRSMADFHPDSHVLIANLASFFIRSHLHGSEDSPAHPAFEQSKSLRENWESTRSRFPRLTHLAAKSSSDNAQQRQSSMLLYGIYVLRYGQGAPSALIDTDVIQQRLREIFTQGVSVWPTYLSEYLNERWACAIDQEETLDYFSERILQIAERVGRCLLGVDPIITQSSR